MSTKNEGASPCSSQNAAQKPELTATSHAANQPWQTVRCRLHGGKSIGPKTEEGRKRIAQASTKHGFYSAESIAERKHVRELIKAAMGNV